MKKIIILGASDLQLPAIIQAKKMGLYVISIDYNEFAPGFHFCDKKYVVSTLDKESVLEIAKKEKISGIMTLASDLPMRTVAFVSERLNLPGITIETSEIVTNKYKMRECFKENEIQSIKYKKISNFIDLENFVKSNNCDSIIKPISSSGSRGIHWIGKNDTREEMMRKFEYTMQFSNNQEIVVEDFLLGREISVETITVEGKTTVVQITDKLTSQKPYFVETGHIQPANLSNEKCQEISNLVEKTINAVGIKNGAAHTEIMISNDGLNVIEIGARLGGDFITTDLVPLSTGVNLVESVIRMSVGLNIDIQKVIDKGSAVVYFNYEEGIVSRIEGLDHAKQLEGIIKLELELNVGDKIPKLSSSVSRYGYVIAQGTDAHDAFQKCKQAIKLVRVKITEDGL